VCRPPVSGSRLHDSRQQHTHSGLELPPPACRPRRRRRAVPSPMDPAAADRPCVIQSLPANCNTLPPPLVQALPANCNTLPPPLVQALPAKTNPSQPSSPTAKRRHAPPAPGSGPAPPSPRRTRSGGAPEWTPAETLALVAEVAAVDDGWSRSVSAFQKWAMVAENLAASEALLSGPGSRRRGRGSKRTAGECRRRWEALAAEYGAVRRWEVRTGATYWEMGAAARRKAGLPAEFDDEVYGAMDALIRVEEALLADAAGGGAGGEDVEGLVGGGAGCVGVEVGKQDGGDSVEAEVGEEQVQQDASAGEEEEQDVDEDVEEMQEDGGNAGASNDLGMCKSSTFRF
jgi:hypothetical protein